MELFVYETGKALIEFGSKVYDVVPISVRESATRLATLYVAYKIQAGLGGDEIEQGTFNLDDELRDAIERVCQVTGHRQFTGQGPQQFGEHRSEVHHEKFVKLRELVQQCSDEVKLVNGIRFCCSQEFLLGKGSEGTRVYIGLEENGYERAVKRLPKDVCVSFAEQEMRVLNQPNVAQSNNVVRHWSLDKTDREYIFLILDLCEETLENFVQRKKNDSDLATVAPEIIRQVLKGLADLHRGPKPVLHRDLKPANILRDVHGKWLLADFGISRILLRGESTHVTTSWGTQDWTSVESYCSGDMSNNNRVRYKKESDIQVAGMVAFYVACNGQHPFGEKPDRLRNLLDGKPVGLDELTDYVQKDFLSWMLSHDPKDRPSAEEALKHPYLQTAEKNFEMLCAVGNETEIKTGDASSDIVRQLNSDPTDWRNAMRGDVLKYLHCDGAKTFKYGSSWTACLRLIRNVNQHWKDRPRPLPQPEAFYEVGDPQEYFLRVFPNLPTAVHRIVRSGDWKERKELKKYFVQG